MTVAAASESSERMHGCKSIALASDGLVQDLLSRPLISTCASVAGIRACIIVSTRTINWVSFELI